LKERRPKRYILLEADGMMNASELDTLTRLLERRHGKLAMTLVERPRTALIVKTDRVAVSAIRETCTDLSLGDRRVKTILTSGSIVKLKRIAQRSSAREFGEVSE